MESAAGYAIGHEADGYKIPGVIMGSYDSRGVKALTIGAGNSGILMAYRIQTEYQKVEHNFYEKRGDIGGTWLENRYPGAACDVSSHIYMKIFALSSEWYVLVISPTH